MKDAQKLVFYLGCLTGIWLYMSFPVLQQLINAPIVGVGKAAEYTLDAWIDIKKRDTLSPR